MRRKSKTRKNFKGGFLNFFSKPSVVSSECDPNQLSMIKDKNELREKYTQCCPKNMFGQKNSSPYCKQIDLNWQAQEKYDKNIAGYYGDETDPEVIKNMMNAPIEPVYEEKKAWYKFWGGKTKSKRRNKRKNKKYTRKNRK
jgi:hypothetical protein